MHWETPAVASPGGYCPRAPCSFPALHPAVMDSCCRRGLVFVTGDNIYNIYNTHWLCARSPSCCPLPPPLSLTEGVSKLFFFAVLQNLWASGRVCVWGRMNRNRKNTHFNLASVWQHSDLDSKRAVFAAGLSSAEYQQPGKASCVSINWTLGDAQVEVINTATGRRRDSGTPSRLCKHALFTRWSRLHRKVSTEHTESKWVKCNTSGACQDVRKDSDRWLTGATLPRWRRAWRRSELKHRYENQPLPQKVSGHFVKRLKSLQQEVNLVISWLKGFGSETLKHYLFKHLNKQNQHILWKKLIISNFKTIFLSSFSPMSPWGTKKLKLKPFPQTFFISVIFFFFNLWKRTF